MIILNTRKAVLLILLTTSITSKSISDDTLNLIAGTAITSTIIFGVYKFAQWLFYESNEKLINRVEKELQRYFTTFGSAVTIVESAYPIRILDSNSRLALTSEVNEQLLYSLLPAMKAVYSNSENYILELQHTVSIFKKDKINIEKRINSAKSRKISRLKLDKLKEISNKIEYQLVTLEFLNKLIQNHKSYFQLSQRYTNYANAYQKELNLLNCNNSISLGYELKRCALVKFQKTKYPYLEFENQISKDIDQFSESICRSAYNYQSLIYYCNQLLQSLKTIHEYILTDPDYHQEKIRKENDVIERERLLIAQREAAAKELQAKAKLQQNQILMNQQPNQQVVNVYY